MRCVVLSFNFVPYRSPKLTSDRSSDANIHEFPVSISQTNEALFLFLSTRLICSAGKVSRSGSILLGELMLYDSGYEMKNLCSPEQFQAESGYLPKFLSPSCCQLRLSMTISNVDEFPCSISLSIVFDSLVHVAHVQRYPLPQN